MVDTVQELELKISQFSDSITLMNFLTQTKSRHRDWENEFFLPEERSSYRKYLDICHIHFPFPLEVNCFGRALLNRDLELANRLLDFPSFNPDPDQNGWVLDLAILRQDLTLVRRLVERDNHAFIREHRIEEELVSYRSALNCYPPYQLATADIAVLTNQDDIFDYLISQDVWPSLESVFTSGSKHVQNTVLERYPFLSERRDLEIRKATEKCWYLVASKDPYSLEYLAFFDPLIPELPTTFPQRGSCYFIETYYEMALMLDDSLILTDKVLCYNVNVNNVFASALKMGAVNALVILVLRKIVTREQLEEKLRWHPERLAKIDSIIADRIVDKHGYFPCI